MKNKSLNGWILIVCLILVLGISRHAYPQGVTKEEYDKLKNQYNAVVADRDNILAQSKILREYK